MRIKRICAGSTYGVLRLQLMFVSQTPNLPLAEKHFCRRTTLSCTAGPIFRFSRSGLYLLTLTLPVCVRHGRNGAAFVGELTFHVVTFVSPERLRADARWYLCAADSEHGWVGLRVTDPAAGAPTSAVPDGLDLQERNAPPMLEGST